MENKVYIDPYPKTMKMLGLERINIDCGNNTSIVTPANIAKDMVALLPDEVFTPEIPSANAIFQIPLSHHLCPESF